MESQLSPTLDAAMCRDRLLRLRQLLDQLRLDAAVLTDPRDIYRLTGDLLPAELPALLRIDVAGECRLTAPLGQTRPTVCDVVDSLVVYEWHERGTRHPDLEQRLFAAAASAGMFLSGRNIGCCQGALLAIGEAFDGNQGSVRYTRLDDELANLARRKDADEIAIIRASVRANQAAYAAAAKAIAPGSTELEVLAAGQRGAMVWAGEKLMHDGDYRCGAYNGPARNRPIEAGELYIIDAWTCFRGYWADMARTFVVGRRPTDLQQSLFDCVVRALSTTARLLRPGVDGRELYASLDSLLREHPALADDGLTHHGGHAIGLRAHEMPDVNPNRGGVLEEGDVICLEPGGYPIAARCGVRMESMYLITNTGSERLDDDEYCLTTCS